MDHIASMTVFEPFHSPIAYFQIYEHLIIEHLNFRLLATPRQDNDPFIYLFLEIWFALQHLCLAWFPQNHRNNLDPDDIINLSKLFVCGVKRCDLHFWARCIESDWSKRSHVDHLHPFHIP